MTGRAAGPGPTRMPATHWTPHIPIRKLLWKTAAQVMSFCCGAKITLPHHSLSEMCLFFGVRWREQSTRAARVGTPPVTALVSGGLTPLASVNSVFERLRQVAEDQSGAKPPHSKERSVLKVNQYQIFSERDIRVLR
jgi:hypothetical protein